MLLAIKKKNEILPFATVLMDLESIRHSEITQRKTNTLSLVCGIYEQMSITKKTDSENKLVITSGEKEGGGVR